MVHQEQGVKDLIKSLQTAMEARRAPWVPYWQEAAELFFQDRALFTDSPEEEIGQMTQLYNTAGTRAVAKSTAGFIGATSSRTARFFKFSLSNEEYMTYPGVADYLELAEKYVYAELNRSNFYGAIGELVPNWFVICTAPLFIEDDVTRGKVTFIPNHPRDVLIDEDETGMVDMAIRTVYLSGKALLQRFGSNLDKKIKERAQKNPIERIKVWHAILPMDADIYEPYKYKYNKKFPFASIWYMPEEDFILDIGGYYEFPMPTGRYQKNVGSVYGRGPGLNTIHEALMANQISKSRLRLSQLTSDPPWLTDKNLQGKDDIIPGNHIYRDGPNEDMRALDVGAHYPNTVDTEKRLDDIIYESFNVDMWMALQRSERARTAFEVDAILSEHASILGPMTDRYNTEILSPAIKRTYAIALRNGRLPPPPMALLSGKTKVVIEFIGYLSQLQRKQFQTMGLNVGMAHLMQTAQVFPNALDVVDGDELMRIGLDGYGVSQRVIRDEDEVLKIRQAKMQLAAQQAQSQMIAQAQMEQAKKIDPQKAPEPGSIMERQQ